MFPLSKEELKILKKLNTPIKIQDFLDKLPINFEEDGVDTLMSPRRVLKERKAHCIEGALLASLCLWLQGQEPLLMDFKTLPCDEEHVVALFKQNGFWGAISKTNHPILRFRDPVYKTPRELAMSYFHEYFMFENGKKTLRSFSAPFNLKKYPKGWLTSNDDLWYIGADLDDSRHFEVIPKNSLKFIRKADKISIKAGKIIEWKKQKKHNQH